MINLIWGSSFKKAYRKTVKAHPRLKFRSGQFSEAILGEFK